MSCIVGIINLDGAPVDRELLERMTGAMKARAPDESNVWVSGNVGFGHAMLRISPESENEHQPSTLDNQVWIAADARIDGQAELIRKLRSAGRQVQAGVPDVELILHVYHAFGESFLDHLIGDFALALWDGREKKLICARDHLGVRPFFYYQTGRTFLFASDINALLVHPAVSGSLDETAVGDFLMLGNYLDPEISIYRDIRRLPAAMCLTLAADGVCSKKKYWDVRLPIETGYINPSELLEQFAELFDQAVNDRLRAESIVTELSGGMDSTTIAAVAAPQIRAAGGTFTAICNVCTPLLPNDREGYYAGLAAAHLDIPLKYRQLADYQLFERYDMDCLAIPEPLASADLAFSYDVYRDISEAGVRVVLSGFGADAVLSERREYYSGLLKQGRLFQLMAGLYGHWRVKGTLAGVNLRSALFHKAIPKAFPFKLPDWLDAGFVKRIQLDERWRFGWDNYLDSDPQAQLSRPYWSRGLEGEYFGLPVEARYPFMDVRLVKFLIALPNFLKYDKFVTREYMRERLPEQIRTRPKEGLAGDPLRARFEIGQTRIAEETMQTLVDSEYVNGKTYFQAYKRYLVGEGEESTFSSYFINQPLAFAIWRAHT